jgi:trehalose 6-phosphate phosphatase
VLDRLAPWLTNPSRAAVLTDFDGTLAAIVDDPTEAVPLPGVSDTLERLARRYIRVAVISGRPVDYLVKQLGRAAGVVFVGLYGLEQATGGETPAIEVAPEAIPWAATVDRVAAEATAEAPPGVGVEHKGLALTLHVRTAPEQVGWAETWAASHAKSSGLVVHPGKKSVELRPPVNADKGTVVTELAKGLDAVCFVGDDRGDLPAFAALARLSSALHTLAVAVNSDEVPKELLDAADLVVDGPAGAVAFLQQLAAT